MIENNQNYILVITSAKKLISSYTRNTEIILQLQGEKYEKSNC